MQLIRAWKHAIDEEMEALASRGTWELVSAPTVAVVVGFRWVFALKYRQDGSWINIRPCLWPRVILKHMTSTILRRSHQLSG